MQERESTTHLSESARLQTLADYHLMDTPADPNLDRITLMATQIWQTPVGLISLVDANRQWWKSAIGVDRGETDRDIAFCSMAIESDDLFVIEDLTKDERSHDNPLVTGEMHARFYAGAPSVMRNGYRIGTLCVLDRKARHAAEEQLFQLQVLRDAVVNYMELKRVQDTHYHAKAQTLLCSWCGNVHDRHDAGDKWVSAAAFLADMTQVSHGICPDCAASHH